MQRNVCVIIMGPTAVGKTALSIELAKHFKTSIVSADSRQCFRELNIAVAKPTATQLLQVKHYFINTHSIHEEMSAAVFEQYSLKAVQEIFQTNRLVLMVGGTGLYIKAFCEGLDEIPPIPVSVTESIRSSYKSNGITWLQNEIKKGDPDYYNNGEVQNPQRLMRALEVKIATGQSIRKFQEGGKQKRNFEIIKIGLDLPRQELYNRINQRVDEMMREGLMDEVKSLHSFRNLNALQTVGYTELYEYLDEKIPLNKAIENIKKNTRHYAKRQLTWFRKDKSIHWFNGIDFNQIINQLQKLVQ